MVIFIRLQYFLLQSSPLQYSLARNSMLYGWVTKLADSETGTMMCGSLLRLLDASIELGISVAQADGRCMSQSGVQQIQPCPRWSSILSEFPTNRRQPIIHNHVTKWICSPPHEPPFQPAIMQRRGVISQLGLPKGARPKPPE